MTNHTQDEIRHGRRRMKEHLPRVRAKARASLHKPDPDLSMEVTSHRAQSMMQEVEERHMHAFVIYQRRDGWRADIVMKGMPVGVPEILGTQDAHPLDSEAEARQAGEMILFGIIWQIEERKVASRDTPLVRNRWFRVFEEDFSIPAEVIDKVAQVMSVTGYDQAVDLPNRIARLDEILAEMTGGEPFTGELWDAADPQLRLKSLAAMAMLLICGVISYPLTNAVPAADEPSP